MDVRLRISEQRPTIVLRRIRGVPPTVKMRARIRGFRVSRTTTPLAVREGCQRTASLFLWWERSEPSGRI